MGAAKKFSFGSSVDRALCKIDSDVNFGDCLQLQAGGYYAEHRYCNRRAAFSLGSPPNDTRFEAAGMRMGAK
jgi:hypothetical protein